MSLNCSGMEIGPHPTGLFTTPGVTNSGFSSSEIILGIPINWEKVSSLSVLHVGGISKL